MHHKIIKKSHTHEMGMVQLFDKIVKYSDD
jgi:hypothetical protein